MHFRPVPTEPNVVLVAILAADFLEYEYVVKVMKMMLTDMRILTNIRKVQLRRLEVVDPSALHTDWSH